MLALWNVINKYEFPPLVERQSVSIPLPLHVNCHLTMGLLTLVAGTIPSGMVLFGTSIVGTPNEVPNDTTSTAVFRASVDFNILSYERTTFNGEVISVVTIDAECPQELDNTPFKIVESSVLTVGSTFYVRNLVDNKFTLHRTLYESEARKSPVMFDVSNTHGQITYYEDRTLLFTVVGSDSPQWVTPEGLLTVNPSGHIFVLYNTPVDFQLVAIDDDISSGQNLEFFIESYSGELPPGLVLSKQGRIHGIIGDAPSVSITAGTGDFDTNWYIEELGVEDNTARVRKLSRTYEFVVSCSDGMSITKRQFRIYVIPEEFLRSDNSIIQVGHGAYTVDVTYLRAPYWMNDSDLGQARTNNRLTIFLETYDPNPKLGIVEYFIDPLNTTAEGVVISQTGNTIEVMLRGNGEVLPSDMFYYEDYRGRDTHLYQIENVSQTGSKVTVTGTNLPQIPPESNIIFGKPYAFIDSLRIDRQNGILYGEIGSIANTELQFTVGVTKIDTQYVTTGNYTLTVADIDDRIIKVAINGDYEFNTEQLVKYLVGRILVVGPNQRPYWIMTATISNNLLVLELDRSPNNDTFVGDVIPMVITQPSSWIYATATNRKTFKLSISDDLLGDFRWVTDTVVGTLVPNKPSTLRIQATGVPNIKYYVATTYDNNTTTFSEGGVVLRQDFNIRDGIRVDQDSGLIIGELSKTSDNIFSFDGGSTTLGREFTTNDAVIKFTAFATAEVLGEVQTISKQFVINVGKTTTDLNSNLWLKSFMPRDKRDYFKTFIDDTSIFPQGLLYRPQDPSFGVQKEVKMLLASGIRTGEYQEYIDTMTKNFQRKKLMFGDVKTAQAFDKNNHLYDVVYVELRDLQENELGKSISKEITVNNETMYPNSIENMRERLFETFGRNTSLNPLWMLTPQDDGTISGYVKAVVLCYCVPNSGSTIVRNILNSGFNFTNLTFDVDRVIIDTVIENGELVTNESFLLYPEKQINLEI